MIANFYNTIADRDTSRRLPAKVVAELNKELPKGFKYEYEPQSGQYMIVPTLKNHDMGFKGEINRKKNGIPEDIPQSQIFEYMYRIQKPLEVDNVEIGEGEKRVKLDTMLKDPITGASNVSNGKFFFIPKPFPDPLAMIVETADNEKQSIQFQRQPYESMDYVKYANVSFEGLSIEWILPEVKTNSSIKLGPGKINISVKPEKCQSVRLSVIALKIFRDFMNGDLLINGTKVGKSESKETSKDEAERVLESIYFWENLEKLEKALDVHFHPSAAVPEEDQKFAAELIHNFVDEKDLVYSSPLKQFHVGFDGPPDEDNSIWDLESMASVSLSFVGGPGDATLLGAQFQLFETNVLVDMRVIKTVLDKDKMGAEIFVEDAPGKKYKLIKRYYLTMDDAKNNMKRMFDEHTEK